MLEYLISSVKAIPHVEFVRIGTRIPVTLPQRITPKLIAMFKEYSPLWMSVHFNHAKEVTPRVKHACNMIADAGIPMGSQTVLLRGVNDSPEVMKKLFHELLKIRVVLITFTSATRSWVPGISVPRWKQGLILSKTCAAIPPAKRCRPT